MLNEILCCDRLGRHKGRSLDFNVLLVERINYRATASQRIYRERTMGDVAKQRYRKW